ncbi:hypothetical protein PPL_05849 [Heterostelium album PN500]|uniref:Uncharacterized protein n=1 Tax=Heterostelium pallidum (strain ATCC 26659 / Pp 5 / PN500) TaxID=670386 RepID=D3BBI1_HETP5|nr:hypothetical protein PPL_05849 [Heterostelium album PN500]EFA81014.1 hypothetical protein PPL_05849 [Heterostelium album PN500]|eukprot:XP_020433132.1 hypothetical protein PPL_05849 [Heterostelium album PN500]
MDINNNNNNNHGGEPHYVPGTPFRGITCNKLVMMDTNTAFNQIMSTKVGKASIDSLPKFDFESSTADIESHLLLIESTIPLPNARAKVLFNTLNEKSRALTRNFHVAANASWNEYKSMMVKLFSREFPPEHYVGILAKLKFLPNRDDIVSFNLCLNKNLIKIKLNELKNERKVQDKNINFLKRFKEKQVLEEVNSKIKTEIKSLKDQIGEN